MNSLGRFLKACRCENVDRPPVWLMRQAGRYLPEYRALREKHDFLKLLTNEDLIVEISLQPWRRFKMDAVIVFADILLLPMVMGMDLRFIEGQGPKFSELIGTEKQLEELKPINPEQHIPFLLKSLKQLKKELKSEAALIGFAGSPWTVASYMLQKVPGTFGHLLENTLKKLTRETIVYLKAQIEAGVDVIQIFDSWGGALTAEEYSIWSRPYIKDIVTAIKPTGVPVILYIKESERHLDNMIKTGCDVISVSWETSLLKAKEYKVAIQGNFNPHILMQATPQEVRIQTQNMLKMMEGYPGYIANLGHGVLPKTPVENVAAFVEAVKGK